MYKVSVNGQAVFELQKNKDTYQLNGKDLELDILEVRKNEIHFIYQHKSCFAQIVEYNPEHKEVSVQINGRLYQVKVQDHYDLLLKSMGLSAGLSQKSPELKAPMPGLVLDVQVKEGQQIKKGDNLLVLEAMKMENILKAATDGTVKQVLITKGDKVEKNQLLMRLD